MYFNLLHVKFSENEKGLILYNLLYNKRIKEKEELIELIKKCNIFENFPQDKLIEENDIELLNQR